jgi:predicted nucleic acid-binding protein
MKVYFDTNVLVAAVQPDHIHHAPSFAAYTRVQKGVITGHLAGQGLAEFYSVLTRTPFPIAVSPKEILVLIRESIVPNFDIVDVGVESYLAAIAGCASAGWKGGRVHDAVHIQAAKQAKCDLIYTFDVAHFQSLAPEWSDRIQNPPPA